MRTRKKTHVPNPHKDVIYPVATHGSQVPKRIVIHSTESGDTKGLKDIEAVAHFWQQQGEGLGSHFIIDAEGYLGQGARGDRKCYHVQDHNTGSIGIELIGRARFSRSDWKKRPHQMEKLAREIAFLCEFWGIPVTHSMITGVCMHRDFKGSHWDPGYSFDLPRLLARVVEIRKFYASRPARTS